MTPRTLAADHDGLQLIMRRPYSHLLHFILQLMKIVGNTCQDALSIRSNTGQSDHTSVVHAEARVHSC